MARGLLPYINAENCCVPLIFAGEFSVFAFFKADCHTAFCIIYIYTQLFALYSKKSGKNEKLLKFFWEIYIK